MKGTRLKIPALIAALAVITTSAVSLTGSAVTTVRDATGNGVLTGFDATYTLRYLQGKFNPFSTIKEDII